MGSMRRRWLLLAVILTAPYGCDNVTWGGTEVHLQGPGDQPPGEVSDAAPEEATDTAQAGLPEGPILLAGTRQGDTVTLVAVAEVHGPGLTELPTDAQIPDFLSRFVEARLAAGTEVVLFSDGTRVGRLTIGEAHVDDRFCPPRAAVTGVVEMVPGAARARRFLALLDSTSTERPYTAYHTYDDDYDQRVASLSLAATEIRQVGAAWPPSVLESRADMQAFRLPESTGPGFAATFLYRDRLAVAAPEQNAYAIFVMGEPAQNGYQAAFQWYRRVADEGKGAPRYFDHLDWNGDGTSEVLLDVFGTDRRWFAALAQRNGTWVRTFQDPCGGTGN